MCYTVLYCAGRVILTTHYTIIDCTNKTCLTLTRRGWVWFPLSLERTPLHHGPSSLVQRCWGQLQLRTNPIGSHTQPQRIHKHPHCCTIMFKLVSPANVAFKMNGLRSVRTSIQSQATKRLFSSTQFTKQSFPNYSYSRAHSHSAPRPNMALTFLGVLGVGSLYLAAHKPILNDAGFSNPGVTINTGKPNVYYDDTTPKFDGAFNGKLNYRQVALGSIAGLVIGYALSRLSTVLFFLGITFYIVNVYLRRQGVVILDTRNFFKSAVNNISLDEQVFDQPSFSVPFVMSFLTAATL